MLQYLSPAGHLIEWNKEAAWILFVETKTRISTTPYTDKCDAAEALASLYKLFGIYRATLVGKHNCVEVYNLVEPFLNGEFRHFVTTWGAKRDDLKEGRVGGKLTAQAQFEVDLKELQVKFRFLCDRLGQLCGIKETHHMAYQRQSDSGKQKSDGG